jgi:subtilase family serine protease
MQGKRRKPQLALIVVALVGVAIALMAAASGGHRVASKHVATPFVSIGHDYAIDGAVDPTSQVGPLRGCQTTGVCYGPDQIRVAYGFQSLLNQGIDGSGRTIVIIDAYGSPTLASDTSLFNSYMGLPATNLQTIYPDGTPSPTDPANAFGWAAETTLDVTWAHVVAPGAKIVLVVAKSNNDSDILSATQYVADHNLGDTVSQSFGEAEQCMGSGLLAQQHAIFSQLASENITLFASSGDQGAALPTCDGSGYMKAASTPATDPLVTAVGGTRLFAQPATSLASPGGQWMNETTWNEGVGSATGGGISTVYSRPDYQAPIVKDSKMREVPDISYNAGVTGGVLAVLTCPGPAACGAPAGTYFFRFGGTSAGSPQWAGLTALVDQMAGGRVGGINKTLYHLGKQSQGTYFHDITVGDNSVAASSIPGTPITGFSAVSGWDAATGWGSPIAPTLVPAIAKPGNG